MSKFYCSHEGCEEIVGKYYHATHWEPEEIDLYNEDWVDDDGEALCEFHYKEFLEQKKDLAEQEKEESEDDNKEES